jgi:hypothetical protein
MNVILKKQEIKVIIPEAKILQKSIRNFKNNVFCFTLRIHRGY